MTTNFKTPRWTKVQFESSTTKTDEFMAFTRDFRSDIKKMLKNTDWILHTFNIGHFFIYGFVKNSITGKLMYFSISDVRFFPNEWHNHLLIRTAEHDKDWTGGRNCYTKFRELGLYLTNL